MDTFFPLTIRSIMKLLIFKRAIWYLLFCFVPLCVSESTVPGCKLKGVEASGFTRDGDILLGAVFRVHFSAVQPEITYREEPAPVRCQTFGFQNYQWLQAMVFAIEEINRNPTILPNITLGFQIYDTCTILQRSLSGALWILNGQEKPIINYRCQKHSPPAVIIGDSGSTRSILLAHLLSLYRYPQISYFSSSPLLSDRNQFPSFFRTIPSDDFQSIGLAKLVMYFGWTWVGIIAADDDYGQLGSKIVQQELIKDGACVAFSEYILSSRVDKNAYHIVQVINKSTAKAIVIFSSNAYLIPLMDEILRQNVTGKIWIASEAWSTYSLLAIKKYSGILAGTIGFAIQSGEMVGFQQYFINIHPSKSSGDPYVNGFWEETFLCQWLNQSNLPISENKTKRCTGTENLYSLPVDNMMDFRLTYNIYKAVYASALSLDDLRMCKPGGGLFLQGNCANISRFHPWQLLHYIKKVRLNREDTKPYFDEYGNPPALYDIVNWQRDTQGTIRHVKVGSYDSSALPGKKLIINANAFQWATANTQVPVSVCSPSCPTGFRKATRPEEPICCFLCVSCLLGEISNKTDSIECFKCPWDQWPDEKKERCIAKIIEFISYQDTFGATVAVISIFFSVIPVVILGLFTGYRNTPIIKASNYNLSCLLLLSLSVCFLSSLLFIGYPTQEKCLFHQTAYGITFALCVSCILAKTIMVVIAFNATKPNSDLKRWVGSQLSYVIISICTLVQVLLCSFWVVLKPAFSEYNTNIKPSMIVVECNTGSPILFWCMLGYLALLASISFIVAFLARKLPDSFNEAQCITFSMLAFLSVWISFIPAYLSTKGKYMVAMEVFAILSSGFSLVSGIFFPKCYIILFRSECNTKEYLLGRAASQNTKVKRM